MWFNGGKINDVNPGLMSSPFFVAVGYHKKLDEMTEEYPPLINKPWFINPGLTIVVVKHGKTMS